MHYNFCRIHQSLTTTRPDGKRIKQTPAMAAGVATQAWSVYELVALLDPPKSTDPLPRGGTCRAAQAQDSDLRKCLPGTGADQHK